MDEFLWNKILMYYEHPTAAMIRPYIKEYNAKKRKYGKEYVCQFYDQTLYTIRLGKWGNYSLKTSGHYSRVYAGFYSVLLS